MGGIYMKSDNIKHKHVLILTPGFPENEKDNVCIPALQIYLKALSEKKEPYKISVITFQYPFNKAKYRWNGIDIYAMKGRNRKGLFSLMLWIRVFLIFIKIHKANKVHLVHSFWYTQCALVGSIISAFYKVKHVCTFMGQDALAPNNYAKLILKRPVVVALSDFHAKTISESLNIKPDIIIPWGLESVVKPATCNERKIDVLGIGSLIPVKNYSLFVEIIAELIKKNKELKCLIIGNGPEYNLLKKKIEQLNLFDNLELKGEIQREEVLQYLDQSKVLLHTSGYESFGMVFIEALAAATKIVSKPIGCYQQDIAGWKVGENQIQLKEAILELLEDEKKVANTFFDIDETVKKYLKVYF